MMMSETDWRRLFSHFGVLVKHLAGIMDVGTAFVPRPAGLGAA